MQVEHLLRVLIEDFDRDALVGALRGLRDVVRLREPDVLIGGAAQPYMRRWWLVPRNKHDFNVYLHHFLRSDDDRALHDHPWANVSVLIDGDYVEEVPIDFAEPAGAKRRVPRREGDVAWRPADACHRVELLRDPEKPGVEKPVWTLFLTGPKVREWGFWCPRGWKTWQDFTGQNDDLGPVRVAEVLPGRGCGET